MLSTIASKSALAHDRQHRLRILDADLQADAARADDEEGRVAPGAFRVLGDQHPGAALRAEEEGGLELAGDDEHGPGLPDLRAQRAKIGVVDHALEGDSRLGDKRRGVRFGAGGYGCRDRERVAGDEKQGEYHTVGEMTHVHGPLG